MPAEANLKFLNVQEIEYVSKSNSALAQSELILFIPFPDKKGGAWLPRKRDVNPYVQVDMRQVTTVQQVATQGNPKSAVRNERHKRWVTKFSLEFSQDGEKWTEYQESGELKVNEKSNIS